MLLECHGLRNTYWPTGPGADLCLSDCEIAGISGASGSGKTLLLRAIADLDPNIGEISLRGRPRDQFSGPEWRKHVAYVAAEPAWWGATIRDHFPELSSQASLHALQLSPKLLDQAPQELSTGERQRLALLRAMMLTPQLLLLDEPTAALDRDSTRAIERYVKDYIAGNDAAALWVSHNRQQLERVCTDDVYALRNGVLTRKSNDNVKQAG